MKEITLFLDIETVPQFENFSVLPERFQKLWEKKSFTKKYENCSQSYNDKAGIYAEYGKVIAIAFGYFTEDNNQFRVKGLTGDDEADLLNEFISTLKNRFSGYSIRFCAHNGKEFDYPYLARRCVVHGIPLPHELQLSSKKPWEVQHFDTLEMWKFGDRKNYTSLDTLAAVFNIPSSKTTLDGSEVRNFYYEKHDINAIKNYCVDDVVVTAQIFLKLNGNEQFPSTKIVKL